LKAAPAAPIPQAREKTLQQQQRMMQIIGGILQNIPRRQTGPSKRILQTPWSAGAPCPWTRGCIGDDLARFEAPWLRGNKEWPRERFGHTGQSTFG
jgi:hypothetical protein